VDKSQILVLDVSTQQRMVAAHILEESSSCVKSVVYLGGSEEEGLFVMAVGKQIKSIENETFKEFIKYINKFGLKQIC
jgi:hypothetical protein